MPRFAEVFSASLGNARCGHLGSPGIRLALTFGMNEADSCLGLCVTAPGKEKVPTICAQAQPPRTAWRLER
jgi:hypothetical protein